jgi:hypothetical protein
VAIAIESKLMVAPVPGRNPINEVATILKQMPDQYAMQAYQMLGMFPTQVKVTKKAMRPEAEIHNRSMLKGISVEFKLTTQNYREVLRIHAYSSGKMEIPQGMYPMVYIHLIGHETAPVLALGVSEFVRTIAI